MTHFKSTKVFFITLLGIQGFVWAQTGIKPCDGTKNYPCIVQDSAFAHSPLRWFRDVSKITDTYPGNTLGIRELSISGSEEPSEKGWKEIANYITKHRKSGGKQTLVLDLRQESHGYLNGKPITLVSEYDWINRGKSNTQSLKNEETWLQSLSVQKRISGILSPHQFASKEYTKGKTIPVKRIKTEEELVSRLGFEYHRLYITDHSAPDDSEVDVFVTLIKNAPEGVWFHVHCRGGKGRTTTFLVMYDMLKNADKVSFEELIARHASIAPYYNVSEVTRNDTFLTPYYEQRVIFLTHFYQFAQQFLKGYQGTWSEWKSKSL